MPDRVKEFWAPLFTAQVPMPDTGWPLFMAQGLGVRLSKIVLMQIER